MDLRLLRRRVEMTVAVSNGLHPSVVVFEMAGKCDVPELVSSMYAKKTA